MIKQLISPFTGVELFLDKETNSFVSLDAKERYPIIGNVVLFLEKPDDFYEGAYMNRIKFLPKTSFFLENLPLWLISNGYLWEVRRSFKKGSQLLELGCASGVDYFGSRFNMIGLDLSFQSLKGLHNYKMGLQADATKLPLPDASVDGVISSYFWEHIPPPVKELMLQEFKRVLKPGGKIVFLYDVTTNNTVVNLIKKNDINRYNELFLDGDGHFGYETPIENKARFIKAGYKVITHFGMERTCLQSNSVFEKLRHLNGFAGFVGKLGYAISAGRIKGYLYTFFVRLTDETWGRLLGISKSRIIISVLQVKK
ncbi:MAG: class I SAM-dependent methyltransferase [Daejeonella sp.]